MTEPRRAKADVYDQLLNVMEGYTADGEARGSPLTLSGGNATVGIIGLLLARLFRDLEQHMPDAMKGDGVRTALILILLRWLKLTRMTTQARLTWLVRRVSPPEPHQIDSV
jgi:hypothetical protein